MSFPDPAIPGRPAQGAGPGAFFARRLDVLNKNADKLQTWRNNLLQGLCAVAFCLGLVTMVPSIWAAAQRQNWGMIAADVAALTCIGMLYACRTVRYGLRAFTFLAICYLLALVLLFSIGLLSQPYLLAVPVLCTVLLGLRAGLLALACCGATLFVAGYWGGIAPGIAQLDVGLSMHWTLVALNFLLVAALLVVSCAYLLHGLDGALARQRAVHEALETQIAILQAREVELRESMAARKAAEESNELKSEFLAMISHEVRTPLGGVIGMLRLAKRDDTLSADTRHKLRIGLGNAEVLLHIINDILDFSRLEAGKMPFESIDFDLPALLQDVVALLADRAETKGISLVAELDPGLGQWWRGDPVRLRQVVMNLVGNGVKFTEHGEVRLSARAAPGGGIVLAVSDTGIGIERAAISRLFGKFEQGNAATSRKYGGAGLGLAICKLIVETFGGQISVRSEPGAGSVFEVRLPLPAGRPAVALPVARRAPHAVSLRLLCAEDGSTNQIILRELLSEMGHSVTIADDGAAALDLLARQDFDLVIMDSRMPRMDGIAALRLLRAGAMGVRQPGVPVLALTANAAAEERQRFMEAGANGFLPKPIDEAGLHAEIARQISLLGQVVPGQAELDAMFGLRGATPDRPAAAASARVVATAQAGATFGAAVGAMAGTGSAAVRAAFMAEAPRQLAALRRGLADGDAAAVALHAHSLMGSAGLFGARELAALCGRAEALADRSELAAIAPLAGQLDEQFAVLLARLANQGRSAPGS